MRVSFLLIFFSLSLCAQEPAKRNPNWYLANPHVPEALKIVLRKNEGALDQYALATGQDCSKLQENGLIDFFEKNVMNIIRSKPKICEAFVTEDGTRPISIETSDDRKIISIHTTSYFFDRNKISDEGLLGPHEKILIAALKKSPGSTYSLPRPLVVQKELMLNGLPNTIKKFDHKTEQKKKRPPQLLINTMLMRLWSKLSPIDQLQAVNNCLPMQTLNETALTWDFNKEEQQDSAKNYLLLTKICKAKTMEELLPYLDKSLLTEYSLYASNSSNPLEAVIPLCLNWPKEQIVTPRHLPPTTRDEVLFRARELRSLETHKQDTSLSLINNKENTSLSQDESDALRIYTGNGFDRINTYEMWGQLGLWLLPERESTRIHFTANDTTEAIVTKNLKSALENLDGFSGVSFGGHQLNGHFLKSINLREGATFSPGFFMSTSTDKDVAVRFLRSSSSGDLNPSGYLFVVRNRKGAKIVEFSRHKTENEVLLHPDAKYRILKIEPLVLSGMDNPNAQVVYIEELPKD